MTEIFPGIYQTKLGYLPEGSYGFAIGETGAGKALLETVISTSDETASRATAHTIPAAYPLPYRERERVPPAKKWLRMLLILSASCAVAYEMARQR